MKDYAVYFRLLKDPTFLIELATWRAILIREEVFDNLLSIMPLNAKKNKELILNPSYDAGSDISVGVIKFLLQNHFKSLEKIYNNRKRTSVDVFPIDKQTCYDAAYTYPKAILIEKMETAYDQGLLTEKEYASIARLREKVTYKKMLDDYQEEVITCKSTRGKYQIPFPVFLEILSLPQDALEDMLKNDTIAGIPKEEFVYSLNKFFSEECLFEKYMFPKNMIINENYIRNNVDTSFLEKIFIDLPKYASEVEVNKELWNDILEKVPSEFTKLEKAYFIYYQLCKTFTYDEEYFAAGGRIAFENEHYDVNYIKELTSKQNSVVCYEFNAVFSKFLESLGIPYEYAGSLNYGEGHTYLNCVIDQFCISADSTFSVIYGDMPASKRNLSLNGFKLLSGSESTKEKFKHSIDKVNDYIKQEAEKAAEFQNLLVEYDEIENSSRENLTSDECFEMLITSIEKCTLPPTDCIGYVNTITKNLFSHERKNCCKNVFVKDTEPPEIRNKKYGLALIICYNPLDIKDYSEDNQYYIYTPIIGIQEIAREELEKQFQNSRFQYISTSVDTIPGIDNIGGKENETKTTRNNK